MPTGELTVNLIPKEEIQKRTWEKFLNWVLTYGRYIIIGTEIVVLSAFLFRFKLDRELKNLSDEVKSRQAVVESFGDLEQQTRSLQTHLSTIKNLQKESSSPSKIITSLASLTPLDVIFSQLTVSSSSVTVEATAFSLEGFSSFLEGLKRSGKFENIALGKIGEGRSGLEFTLKFNYKGQ